MISARRRGISRVAAAALASGLLLGGALTGASSAAADEGDQPGGATATLDGLKIFDQAVIHDGGDTEVGAGLFEMSVDNGGTLQTYCIDIHNPTQDKAKYKEASWDESSLHDNANAGKILWILENSYPQVDDLAELADAAGAEELSPETAAAGTQVAIWRFSDGADVTAKDDDAEKLADYLEGAAKDVEEPQASLSLNPPAVSGKSGELLGPITVNTNAQSVSVSAGDEADSAGVALVDKDGNPVTAAADGTELFVDVPEGTEPGSASLTAQATTEVPVGRAFIDMRGKSQTQILAGSSESTVTATATATWANQGPSPAVSAEKNCSAGGVDVMVSNEGDEPFTFTLDGKEYTIEAGGAETVTVPVEEDQAYEITITGPEGFEDKTFSGVLDCETVSTGGNGGGEEETPTPQPSPATVGGGGDDDSGLAETGASSSTPLIAGIAVLLLLLGGGTMLFMKKRSKPAGSGSED